MQVLKNGEICPKMYDSELWKDIFPQIKEDDWEIVEQYLNKEQDNFVVKLRQDCSSVSYLVSFFSDKKVSDKEKDEN